MTDPTLRWTSDRSISVVAPGSASGEGDPTLVVRYMTSVMSDACQGWVEEIIPSSQSVLVVIDPRRISHDEVEEAMRSVFRGLRWAQVNAYAREQELVIPVCYEAAMAPDLGWMAQRIGVTVDEVIAIHSGGCYTVEVVGFSPGFGYLSGLDDRLCTPRREQPRTRVPGGSVGIGGDRTGVYPHPTPGGWNLIGRTPLRLFDADRQPPSLWAVGDRVRFTPISLHEFEQIGRGNSQGVER